MDGFTLSVLSPDEVISLMSRREIDAAGEEAEDLIFVEVVVQLSLGCVQDQYLLLRRNEIESRTAGSVAIPAHRMKQETLLDNGIPLLIDLHSDKSLEEMRGGVLLPGIPITVFLLGLI